MQSDLSNLGQRLRSIRIKACEFSVQKTDQALMEFDSHIFEIIWNLSKIQTRLVTQISIWKLQEQHLAIGMTPQNSITIDIQHLQPIAEQLFNFLCLIYKELKDAEVRAIGMNSNICHYGNYFN